MTFRSDATEGVWSPTQNVAVQTEANVVAIFFFHQCGFFDPTHHIRGCQKIIWNFALKGRALVLSFFWYFVRGHFVAQLPWKLSPDECRLKVAYRLSDMGHSACLMAWHGRCCAG